MTTIKTNIIKNNKLIIQFMGWPGDEIEFITPPQFNEVIAYKSVPAHYFTTNIFKYRDAKFNKSVDWLIPVIEKIESLGYGFYVDVERKTKAGICINMFGTKAWIKEAYNNIIEFINWYNQQLR